MAQRARAQLAELRLSKIATEGVLAPLAASNATRRSERRAPAVPSPSRILASVAFTHGRDQRRPARGRRIPGPRPLLRGRAQPAGEAIPDPYAAEGRAPARGRRRRRLSFVVAECAGDDLVPLVGRNLLHPAGDAGDR